MADPVEPIETVHVRNLPPETSHERLTEAFSAYGEVKCVRLMTHRGSDECRGFAFVDYGDMASAERAIKEACETEFMGRRISVVMARHKFGDNPHAKGDDRRDRYDGFDRRDRDDRYGRNDRNDRHDDRRRDGDDRRDRYDDRDDRRDRYDDRDDRRRDGDGRRDRHDGRDDRRGGYVFVDMRRRQDDRDGRESRDDRGRDSGGRY